MKKILLVLIAVLMFSSVSAQLVYNEWFPVVIEDEFGDPTGESANILLMHGTFKNSATTGDKLTAKIVDYGDGALCTLFEYNSSPATVAYGEFGYVSVKQPTGTVVKVKGFASDTGGVYFSKNNYNDLMEVLTPGCKVHISSDSFDGYGSSSWTFIWNSIP